MLGNGWYVIVFCLKYKLFICSASPCLFFMLIKLIKSIAHSYWALFLLQCMIRIRNHFQVGLDNSSPVRRGSAPAFINKLIVEFLGE